MDTDVRISVRALVAERFNHMNKALHIFIPHLQRPQLVRAAVVFVL